MQKIGCAGKKEGQKRMRIKKKCGAGGVKKRKKRMRQLIFMFLSSLVCCGGVLIRATAFTLGRRGGQGKGRRDEEREKRTQREGG